MGESYRFVEMGWPGEPGSPFVPELAPSGAVVWQARDGRADLVRAYGLSVAQERPERPPALLCRVKETAFDVHVTRARDDPAAGGAAGRRSGSAEPVAAPARSWLRDGRRVTAYAYLVVSRAAAPSNGAPPDAAATAAWEQRLKNHMRETVWSIPDPVSRQARYESERAAFIATDPPPAQPQAVRSVWRAEMRGSEPVELAEASEPLPRAAVAEPLTTLAGDGWRVVHVSEDRVMDGARTAVDGLTFLLAREPAR